MVSAIADDTTALLILIISTLTADHTGSCSRSLNRIQARWRVVLMLEIEPWITLEVNYRPNEPGIHSSHGSYFSDALP